MQAMASAVEVHSLRAPPSAASARGTCKSTDPETKHEAGERARQADRRRQQKPEPARDEKDPGGVRPRDGAGDPDRDEHGDELGKQEMLDAAQDHEQPQPDAAGDEKRAASVDGCAEWPARGASGERSREGEGSGRECERLAGERPHRPHGGVCGGERDLAEKRPDEEDRGARERERLSETAADEGGHGRSHQESTDAVRPGGSAGDRGGPVRSPPGDDGPGDELGGTERAQAKREEEAARSGETVQRGEAVHRGEGERGAQATAPSGTVRRLLARRPLGSASGHRRAAGRVTLSCVRPSFPWSTSSTMRFALASAVLLAAAAASAQTPPVPDVLDEAGPKAAVLVLGTFHFASPGRDRYRPRFAVDMLSAERQREVEDVVEQLAAYRPTRIAVEVLPERQAELDSLYDAYRTGHHVLGANEVYQLGFRLGARLGHDRVYAVDAPARLYEAIQTQEEWDARVQDFAPVDTTWDARYRAFYAYEDSLKTVLPLGSTLRYLNSPARVRQSHGAYLVGSFRLGTDDDPFGPDWATRWFNRNLRIFYNLQRITRGPDERLLLLIEAGHVPLIQSAVVSSPEYRLVEVGEVLR